MEYDKDVEMTDDIFCVSYLSYYYLHKKELLETQEKGTYGTYREEIREEALEQDK